MAIISITSLTKTYGSVTVVNRLSLTVEKGMIYGFLGLNGAGKTTTMRMLLQMIKPTSGHCMLFGKAQGDAGIWRKVGYMIESTHAYPELTVRENLLLFYQYYGLDSPQVIDEIIDKIKLRRYEKTRAKFLSMGNLQRLGIARALMHKPELLILDEPVNGLDPAGIVEVRQLLKRLAGEGVTIFISSHLLSEISKIADKIGIIHQGDLIREISIDQLSGQLHRKVIVDTNDNQSAYQLLASSGVQVRYNDDKQLEISGPKQFQSRAEIARYLLGNNLSLWMLYPWEEDLEHFFLRIIRDK